MRNTRIALAVALTIATTLATAQNRSTQEPTRGDSAAARSAEARVSLDIPAGDLSAALKALNKQTGADLIYRPEQVRGLKTRGVKGELTAKDAIARLLEGTPLRASTDPATGAMLIAAPQSAAASGAPPAEQTKAPAPGTREPRPSPSSSNFPITTSDPLIDDSAAIVKGIPEVLVKGSQSFNADIRRTEDDIQPYVVFTAEEIERSAAANLEDFLKSRLPMNTVKSTDSQNFETGSNQSTVDLRGLGRNQTLVLINGRRRPGVSRVVTDDNFGQPDLNGIPPSMVERIEVLPTTASGIYGGGATGGVINIILRNNYRGVEIKGGYDNTFASDVARRSYTALAGLAFGPKTTVQLSGSYSDSNVMAEGERDFTTRGRQLLLQNNPDAMLGPNAVQPAGYLPNIRNTAFNFATGKFANLVLKPQYGGATLSSPITHVPAGYAGTASDGVAGLIANAGTYDLDLGHDYNGTARSLLNGPRTYSFGMNARHDIGNRVSLFVDASFNSNEGRTAYAGVPTGGTINANAPNNPFTTAIAVTFPSPGLGFLTTFKSEAKYAMASAIVRLAHDWSAQLEYGWGTTTSESRGGTPIRTNATFPPNPAQPATGTAVGNGTLDVLRDLNVTPLDYTPYLLDYPNSISGPSDSTMRTANVRLSGPVLRLPAGPLTLSGFFEHRELGADAAVARRFVSFLGRTSDFYYPERSDNVNSYYLETLVPLVSRYNERLLLKSLELQASVRRDEYTTRAARSGGFALPLDPVNDPIVYSEGTTAATGYTLGFRYAPVQSLALRASYGYGFLPPSVAQIGAVIQEDPTSIFVRDPKRGSEPAFPHVFVTGGNPHLLPEDSDSWSAGMIFTPEALAGLRLSVDYTRIEKVNEIATVDVLQYESLYPERVIRGPKLATDPPGYAGPITYLDMSLVNLNRTDVSAVDLQADYTFDAGAFGRFDVYALGTHQLHFKRKLNVLTTTIDSVGYNGGPLQWRANGGVTWKRGAWTVGWATQFFDSYKINFASDSATPVSPVPALNQGSDHIPSQVYHDLSVRYAASRASYLPRMLEGLELQLGLQNIFNTSPPILATSSVGGYSTYGDPRLRRYSLSASARF